ncbi:fatty acid CoA ligase family protein [Saccharothrix obliqua]|uniref:fatty acid CoA ligase family protein n=1 Tax=Saccharothrix obliqua TaxID=2861747 RepID=UPI001C5E9BEC|nr:fatty acid CoA ligase family protein [Saccharothrix obliqua]MBW4718583.1 AMP-binding protein [Saccharothrix obliqua]
MTGTSRTPHTKAEDALLFGAFAEHAARNPGGVALRYPAGHGRYAGTTYRELAERVDACEAALWHAGVRPGMRACQLVPPGPEQVALLFALGRLGAVPVLVDPAIGPRALKRCLAETAPEVLIGVRRAHVARRALRWPEVRIPITVGRGWPRAADVPGPRVPPERAGPGGLIAFTSGSTGPPKPVEYRPEHVAAQLRAVRRLFDAEPGTPVVSTFAPFTPGGPALGLELVVPDVDLLHPARIDPAKLVDAVERFDVRGLLGSPVVLDALARHCAVRGLVLRTLRVVASAGASLDHRLARRLRRCLPDDAELHSVYGATECLPISAVESREMPPASATTERGLGTCLGRPLEDASVRVIRVDDSPIEHWSDDLVVPTGTVGEITVSGPTTSTRYPGRVWENALAKIRDGTRVVHRTGDLGHFDEDGRLWFSGRKSQRVRPPGAELRTEEVEPIADAVPGVRRSALVGVGRPGAQVPVLCVEAERGVNRWAVRRRVLDALTHHPHTRAVRHVLFHRGFPVDPRHNSKIVRERLADWAAGKLR